MTDKATNRPTTDDLKDSELNDQVFTPLIVTSLNSRVLSLNNLVHNTAKFGAKRTTPPYALEMCKEGPIDVAIIEIEISQTFEGIQLVKDIRRNRPLLPILVICQNENLEIKLLTFQAGATDYQTSSITTEELTARILSLSQLGQTSRLVELQNDELSYSMKQIEEAEAESEASRAALIQTAKLASIGEMAANVAHEINNPLTTLNLHVMQLTNLFSKQFDADKANKIVGSLSEISKRIAKIVKGIKVSSRDGSKDPLENTSLKQLVYDTLAFCSANITHSGIKLDIADIPESLFVECRPTQISQVLLNLLGNARDAVKDSENSWISLTTKHDGHIVTISITDSGHGIPEENREKIFEPFFTTKSPNKGTGLGLGICRRILSENNGSIRLDEMSPNTCFQIQLNAGLTQSD